MNDPMQNRTLRAITTAASAGLLLSALMLMPIALIYVSTHALLAAILCAFMGAGLHVFMEALYPALEAQRVTSEDVAPLQ